MEYLQNSKSLTTLKSDFFFEIFIKDLLRNASGYFSEFQDFFCKSSIFRLWESLGSFLVVSVGWKVTPGNLESFQKFGFEKFAFPLIFYIQTFAAKLESFFLWRLATLTCGKLECKIIFAWSTVNVANLQRKIDPSFVSLFCI